MKEDSFEIASLQQGYFTARQAKEAGYLDSLFSYHQRRSSDALFTELIQDSDLEKFRHSIQENFSDFPDPRLQRGVASARRCATHDPQYLRGRFAKVFC